MNTSLRVLLECHAATLASCRRCRHPIGVVPITSLAPSPKVMLVGQAPGRAEATTGRPFAGRAGRTLFRWLARAGLDEQRAREQIYIAAVTRCYPGPSPSGRGDRVPSASERALCAGWLEDELRMIRPHLLIPVGRLAIDRFLEPEPLEKLIGRVRRVSHAGGTSLAIPLPHPSGASSWIHQPGHQARLDAALHLLRVEFSRLGILHMSTRWSFA
jgi:uracil-DNA glycosylase